MQKSLITILVAVLMAPTLSFAEKGDIVVRARVTHIAPDESSHLDSSVGDKLEVDSNTIPEIDFSYYFTKNIAAELILAVGSRHDVNIGGGVNAGAKLGSINLLPPTLTAQWHFNPDQTIDPYVGAGMSYIRAMDRNLNLGTTGITDWCNNIKRSISGCTNGSPFFTRFIPNKTYILSICSTITNKTNIMCV
jgi:outer membrane protein